MVEVTRTIGLSLGAVLLTFAVVTPAGAQPASEWTVVDYSELLDGRQLSHTGQLSLLIDLLDGRPVPPPGQRPSDLAAHVHLDPAVEPYGFVLSDALDVLESPHELPLVEIGRLWQPGERQPAWVDLLRTRRFVVESDGAGKLRVVLPWEPSGEPRQTKSVAAAEQAWDRAWPVLRHVFAAERRRLAAGAEPPALDVRVYPYAHAQARSVFLLGKEPYRVAVDDTRSKGDRPPLDLIRLREFFDTGWTLEGGRLDPQGRLTPFGSPRETPATLLGRKLDISDLAVAYRAVSHSGIGEPYMTLHPAHSPWQSVVAYGGRLPDTSLGWVSLLCDIRFKTFSMGLGIEEGRDLRDELRAEVPSFKTHIERFAADPSSAEIFRQRTRLWFYPDRVDLTVAPESDVLALRHVRMSAASERLGNDSRAAEGEDPPWTKATIAGINDHYDALARLFPELADLDQVIRLLSFFTWLSQAASAGVPLPDVDALLAFELPALPTPRMYPQMLSFNALPAAGSTDPVDSFDRVPVVDAMDLLNPRQGALLDPQVRLQRALAGLEASLEDEAAFVSSVGQMNLATLKPVEVDLLVYRAQRLRMHRTVLGSLDPQRRQQLDRRAGGPPRVFSVGVGGLDLGMRSVLDRARSRSIGLIGAGAEIPRASAAPSSVEISPETRAAWREDPRGLPQTVMPDHGIGQGALKRTFGTGWIETASGELRVVYGAAGPDAVARQTRFGADGKPVGFERYEGGRKWRYTLEPSADGLRAVRARAPDRATPPVPATLDLPSGLALMSIDPDGGGDPAAPSVTVRLEAAGAGPIDAHAPRGFVQRLVLGRHADLAHDPSLPGIAPLPAVLGDVESLMLLGRQELKRRPWEVDTPIVAGEQDPLTIAAAINAWWDAPDALPAPGGAVVGVDRASSPKRWADAPRPGTTALLVLPPDAFPQTATAMHTGLAQAWTAGRVSAQADPVDETLVLVVSAEAPGSFATRLLAIAEQPEMKGKLLAGWCLAGPMRDDLAPWILERTAVAGLGLAEGSVVSRRDANEHLRTIVQALKSHGATDRVESIPGPFLWHF